jgi:hypothetical protein
MVYIDIEIHPSVYGENLISLSNISGLCLLYNAVDKQGKIVSGWPYINTEPVLVCRAEVYVP